MFGEIMTASEKLKDSTKSLHHYLDHLPMMQGLVSPQLTLCDYIDVLSMLGSWYQALEKQFSPYWLDLDWRPKAPLILKDIKTINSSAKLNQIEFNRSNISNEAFALGVFYVCEGATLGGQVIRPRVIKHLKRDDITAYYECYGEACYQQWRTTTHYFNTRLLDNSDIETAIKGAQWAFSQLIDLIESTQDLDNAINYA